MSSEEALIQWETTPDPFELHYVEDDETDTPGLFVVKWPAKSCEVCAWWCLRVEEVQ